MNTIKKQKDLCDVIINDINMVIAWNIKDQKRMWLTMENNVSETEKNNITSKVFKVTGKNIIWTDNKNIEIILKD
jgi:hypothetical protein